MLGFKLVQHAIKVLFFDFWATIRLTVFPIVVGGVAVFCATYFVAGNTLGTLESAPYDGRTTPDLGLFLAVFLSLAILIVVGCWAAVGWHRFVLLEEQPGSFFPMFSWSYVKSYIWAGLRIFLLLFIILVVLMFVLTVVVQFLSAVGLGAWSFLLVLAVVQIIGMALFFRFSLVLPAAALGQPMSLRQSSNATRGQTRTFLTVALLLAGLGFLANYTQFLGVAGLILWVFLSWLSFALGISILTTFYGVYVEKREL
jgi:hypothetical protein